MDTTIEAHPLIGAYHEGRAVLSYTETGCPIALGFVSGVSPWADPVPGRRNAFGVPVCTMQIGVTLDTRPLHAKAKAPPKNVIYRATALVTLSREMRPLRVEVGAFNWAPSADTTQWRGVPSSGWGSAYSGTAEIVHRLLTEWLRERSLPLLPPLLTACSQREQRSAQRSEADAAKLQADIEGGRVQPCELTYAQQRLAACNASAARYRDAGARALALAATIVATLPEREGSEQDMAHLGALSRKAIADAEAAKAEATARETRAAVAAEARRQEAERRAAEKKRLEDAAPAMLAALQAMLLGVVKGGVATEVRRQAEAAVAAAMPQGKA